MDGGGDELVRLDNGVPRQGKRGRGHLEIHHIPACRLCWLPLVREFLFGDTACVTSDQTYPAHRCYSEIILSRACCSNTALMGSLIS